MNTWTYYGFCAGATTMGLLIILIAVYATIRVSSLISHAEEKEQAQTDS